MIKQVNGNTPKIDPTAYVAPSADILGNVTIGPESSVWFQAVLRGDINFIRVGSQTSIQDGTVIHVESPEGEQTEIGDRVLVGHNVTLHSCFIEDDCLIGLGSIVLHKARVEKGAIVGAGALVTPGMVIPAGMLAVGVPAKVVRPVTEAEAADNLAGCRRYLRVMEVFRDENARVDFLRET